MLNSFPMSLADRSSSADSDGIERVSELQVAIRKWRLKVGDLGFDLLDGMPHLIDLRFADEILFFARSALEVGKLLDSLVAELSEVGLVLNADKL